MHTHHRHIFSTYYRFQKYGIYTYTDTLPLSNSSFGVKAFKFRIRSPIYMRIRGAGELRSPKE